MVAPIALLTDFGRTDPYVGVMEGVILSTCPSVRLVELSHNVAPQDVGGAAFWLARCRRYFPVGTVFLAVVDPGVGTLRRAVAVEVHGQFFVAPDNGLLTDTLAEAARNSFSVAAVEIDPQLLHPAAPKMCGRTFHGRDLFAPAAALLAVGRSLASVGRSLDATTLVAKAFEMPLKQFLTVAGRPAQARVVDRFGNLITDAAWDHDDDPKVHVDGMKLPWVGTYGEAPNDTLVALRGSFDTIEIAVSRGSAHAKLTSGG